MKRVILRIVVVSVVLGIAALAAGKATRLFYTFESWNYLLDDPMSYVTHEADGWLVMDGVPLGGDYVRHMDEEDVPGDLMVTASGRISVDFADGNFYGTVSLWINDMDCSGRFRAKRVDYYETGSWVLHCPDGSKIHETWHFTDTADPTWLVEGTGMLLTPQD